METFPKFIISLCLILVIAIGGLLWYTPLHGSMMYLTPDIYRCTLQEINENNMEQFQSGDTKIITCLYKCKDANNSWLWLESEKGGDGCKFIKTMHKTELKQMNE